MKYSLALYVCMFLIALTEGQESCEERSATASRKFAYEFFGQVLKQSGTDENVFLAPTTFASALSMILLGAQGDTKKQLLEALIPDSSGNLFSEDLLCSLKVYSDLQFNGASGSDNEGVIQAATKLFGEKSYRFMSSFVDNTALFGSELEEVEFQDIPSIIRDHINYVVANLTRGTIKNLFEEGDITRDTVLVIVSAIYFKGLWQNPFSPEQTRTAKFVVNANKSINADFMTRTGEHKFTFSQSIGADLIELPYQESGIYSISMILILPSSSMEFTESRIKEEFLGSSIDELFSVAPFRSVVSIPKFTLSAQYDLKNIIKEMGMSDLVTPGKADLSGMLSSDNTLAPLYINSAVHKTFLEVTEEGTTASGVTGIGFIPLSLPPTFIFDRPFVVVMYEKNSESVLFIGRISNPSA